MHVVHFCTPLDCASPERYCVAVKISDAAKLGHTWRIFSHLSSSQLSQEKNRLLANRNFTLLPQFDALFLHSVAFHSSRA